MVPKGFNEPIIILLSYSVGNHKYSLNKHKPSIIKELLLKLKETHDGNITAKHLQDTGNLEIIKENSKVYDIKGKVIEMGPEKIRKFTTPKSKSSKVHSLRITRKFRVYGCMEEALFFITHIDPNHEILPYKK